MLTISRLKRGEVQLETFNLEIGCAHRRKKMEDEEYQKEDEKDFLQGLLLDGRQVVEKLFEYYQEILVKKKTKQEKIEENALGKGGDPSDPSSPYSSSSSERSSTSYSNPNKQPEKTKSDLPYLKLDIKIDLPTYNGELNT